MRRRGHRPGRRLSTERLSCVSGKALAELKDAVDRTGPDPVLCTGQAGGRPDLTVGTHAKSALALDR
jgi:pyrrolidone-carboxylate peptidase